MSKPFHVPPTAEQQQTFLEEIAKGKTRQEAAELADATSTQFRTFINGKNEESQAFAAKYVAVLEAAGSAPSPLAAKIKELEGVQLVHRLLDETIMRALDSERGRSGSSNRMLYNLSLLKLDDFKPLLEARTRHIHEGSVGIFALPQIDTDQWSLEQHQEFVALRQRMNELISVARPDGAPPLAQLESGGGAEEEIADAEFEEISATA